MHPISRFVLPLLAMLPVVAFQGLVAPQSTRAQAVCLAEYTVSSDAGADVREGSPITYTFTPTGQAGLDGCGMNQIVVNFTLQLDAGSETEVGDFDATGAGFVWNTGDGALQPFNLVSTPIDDLVLEVSESAAFTTSVSASATANGNPVPASISGNNAFSTTILDPNKAPVVTAGAAPDVTEDDGPVALAQAATITDENQDDQTVWVAVSGGTVTTGATDVTFAGSGNGTASFTVSGTLAAVNAALGEATFTPSANVSGTGAASITFTSNDGLVDGAADEMTIDIAHVADTPSITDATTLEDAQNTSGLVVSRATVDGAEVTHFRVGGITNGTLFLSDGTTPVVDGAFITAAEGAAGLRFMPGQNSVVDGSFRVEASLSGTDAGVAGGAATATVTVTPVNDAPSFTKGSDSTVNEDSGAHVTSGWAANMSPGPGDESGQALTFQASVPQADEALFAALPAIDAETGDLTFTPAEDANGQVTVTVSLTDDGETANNGVDTSPDETFTITISAVNDAPSFTKGADIQVNEDAGVHVAAAWASGVSPGPPDEAGQGLTFNVTIPQADATLFAAPPAIDVTTGELSFTPAQNANGQTTVTVSLSDDGGVPNGGANTSAEQAFTITIDPVNDAPSFTKGADFSVNEDSGAHTSAAWASNVSAGPVDEAGQVLTFNVSVPQADEALFAALPAIDASTGELSFTPAQDANGQTTVTVSLSDSGGTPNGGADTSADLTFEINVSPVNDAPVVLLPPQQSVEEDGALTLSKGTGNAISVADVDLMDTPGAEMEVTLVASSTVTLAAVNGLNFTDGDGDVDEKVTFRGALVDVNAALDGLIYTPSPDQRGTGSIVVTARDLGNTGAGGALETSETLTIILDDVNDPPTFEPGPDITVAEDSGSDANPESPGLHTFSAWATNIRPGPPNEADQNVTFIVTIQNEALFEQLPAIDAETGDLTFSLREDANGEALLTVVLADDGGRDNGGQDESASQQVMVTVTPVNDAPVIAGAGASQQTMDESTSLVFSEATGNPIVISDVDAGSGDLEMTLTATSTIALPEGHGLVLLAGESGSSTLTALGTQFQLTEALDGLIYTPEPFFNGEGSLTVHVSDRGNTGAAEGSEGGGAAPLTAEVVIPITITPVNDAPTANDDFFTSFSGATRRLDVLANDTDVENDALSIVSVSAPQGSAAASAQFVLYTANNDFSGTDVFTYVMEDAFGAPAIGTITVEVAGPGVDGDGVDGDVEAGAPNAGDGNGDGVPDNEQEHVASLPVVSGPNQGAYISVSAPPGQQIARVESTKNPAPDSFPQTLGAPAGFLAFEVQGITSGASTVVTIDLPDGVTATDYLKFGPTPENLVSHWYSFAWDGTTGAQFQGGRILLHLTDGLRGDDDLLANGTIVDPGAPVLTQNALPVAPDRAETMDEDTALSLDLLAGVTDPDGDDVTLTGVDFPAGAAGPSGGSHSIQIDGSTLAFMPAADFFGDVALTYQVSDGSGAVVQVRLDVTVAPVQDVPVAVSDTLTMQMNQSVAGNIFANDFDVDGDAFFLAQIDQAPQGTLQFMTGGNITYTPPTDFFGVVRVGYAIGDGPGKSGQTSGATIVLLVEGVATAPVGVVDTFVLPEDTPTALNVTTNDTDVNLDSVRVASFTQATNGTLELQEDGTLLYTPHADFFGEDSFTYIPSDGGLTGPTTTASLTVTPVNDAPVFGDGSGTGADPGVILPAPGPVFLRTSGSISFGFEPASDVDSDDSLIAHIWQLARTDSFFAIVYESEPVFGGSGGSGSGGSDSGGSDSGTLRIDTDTLMAVLDASQLLPFVGQRITLHHRMIARDADGATGIGNGSEVVFERATSVSSADSPGSELPTEVYLDGNYPNPFRGRTTIRFGLPATSHVRLDIHDLTGRLVVRAIDGTLPAGHHDHVVNLGSRLAGGAYLFRLQVNSNTSDTSDTSITMTGVMQLIR